MEKPVKQKNRSRAAKQLHAQKTKNRAGEQALLKAAYLKDKDGTVLQDILSKARSFSKYHTKLAQDGMGARKTGHKLTDGTDEVENYFFEPHERLAHLDRSVGLDELINYIERQLRQPESAVAVTEAAEDSEAEA